jgi:hypothetical protein
MKKSTEILKMAAVTVLSVAVFSASFLGINEVAFAAATGVTQPLHITTAPPPATQPITMPLLPTEIAQDAEEMEFVPPTVTLADMPMPAEWRRPSQDPPSYALSQEEAAQIGARYIWDIFGTCIDGMYVQLNFSDVPSMTNTWWSGEVSTREAMEKRHSIWADQFPAPGHNPIIPGRYSFIIDAVTGARIDIARIPDSGGGGTRDAAIEARMALHTSGWFETDLPGRIALTGLTAEALDAYTEAARNVAKAHFNLTEVVEFELLDLSPNSVRTGTASVDLGSLRFTATDCAGTTADITIPAETSEWHFLNVSSTMSFFIPNFYDSLLDHNARERYMRESAERERQREREPIERGPRAGEVGSGGVIRPGGGW